MRWQGQWPDGSPAPMLWLTYEDLHADLPAALARVAAFLGVSGEPAVLARVAAACAFPAMKRQFAAQDARTEQAGGWAKKNHLRGGRVGDWRAHFSPAQKAAFDAFGAAGITIDTCI